MSHPAQHRKISILFIAGDASGDINTARLAKILRNRHPDWSLHAVGGRFLGEEVLKSPDGRWLADTSDLSAMGIYDSIKVIPKAVIIARAMRKFVRSHRIDVAVLCDWGAFNCRQLEFFKTSGVPVLYYFPPRSWQKAGTSGLSFAKMVKRIATPFEWSAKRLNDAGGEAEWVGHPMLEVKYDPQKRSELRREFGVAEHEKLVALFPGSRLMEIKCLGPRLAETAEILGKRIAVRFIVAAPLHRAARVRKHFPEQVIIVSDRAADVLFACDAAIVKSGTATLEAAVIGAPQVVVYDGTWFARLEGLLLWFSKKNLPFIAMPNIILQRLAVREFIGIKCRPHAIAEAVVELFENASIRETMQHDYREIRRQLGSSLAKTATERTAEILEEMVGTQP